MKNYERTVFRMKMFKKVVSIVAAATLLTSSLAFSFSAGAAGAADSDKVSASASLQSNPQNGVILHAFNWSYNSIKENLPEIAEAGYSAVQTSPVQQPKDYGASTDVAGQWWKLYQPVSLKVAQDTWLGTKAELSALCAEAETYGIKIICDIVVNHMGAQTEGQPTSVSSQINTYQPEIYTNRRSYFRTTAVSCNDNSVQNVVQGNVSDQPDLNTGNSAVQTLVTNLLKECIDCGVDGFRFDAAKHIETPDDGSYGSQFWPTVLSAARSYYTQKTNDTLFTYGEILNTPGASRSYSSYTGGNVNMSITDNKRGDAVLYAVANGNASGAVGANGNLSGSASKSVLWAESHDTYEGSSGSGGFSNTSTVSDSNIIKAWAVVAARKDATSLFFARPGYARMGEASTNGFWKSTAVSEVNKFHNLYVGKSEKAGSSGSIAYIQRGGNGIVLVNCSGTSTSVNISGTGMAQGSYIDTVSGTAFTVNSSGTLTGTIGSSGVAVVYDGETVPRVSSSVESSSFKGDTITLELKLDNATSGTYSIDGTTPVTFTNDIAIKVGSDYNYGETINLTLTAQDGNGNSTEKHYKYTKVEDQGSGIYVWFNAAMQSTWKVPYNVYIYDEDTTANTTYVNGAWPGEAMSYDTASGYWYYEVPKTCYSHTTSNSTNVASSFDLSKSSNTYVIINAISTSTNQTAQYPVDGTAQNLKPKLSGQSHEYAMSSVTSWSVTNRVPANVQIPATVVTKTGSQEPTTTAPVGTTVAPTTVPAHEETFIYGDVDHNGRVDITDATLVQMHIANMLSGSHAFTVIEKEIADVNDDGDIDITDATYIQMVAAEMTAGRAGEEFTMMVYPTTPVVATTAPATTVPATTVKPTTAPVVTTAPVTTPSTTYTVKFTNSLSWSGTIKAYYWGDSADAPFTWDNAPAMSVYQQSNDYGQTVYTIDIPTQYNKVIFTNGSAQTVDIDTGSVSTNYYAKSTMTGTGYDVGTWVEGDIIETTPSTTYTVKFTNSLKWSGTIKAYYWGDSASAPFSWNDAPAMTVDVQDNGYGETVYKIDVPTQYNKVIFTNGSAQTVDIDTGSTSTNYYAKSTQTGGKYDVGTW